MGKKLLLISTHKKDHDFIQAMSKIAEVDPIICENAKAGVDHITKGVDCIFVDVSTPDLYLAFEKSIQDSVGMFSDKINANLVHFIVQSDELNDSKAIISSPLYGNLLQRNYEPQSETAGLYGRFLKRELADKALGLENMLSPGAKIQTIKFTRTSQKQDAVEAIRNYVISAKFKARLSSVIANAVDELLMNAMFDAPVDEMNKRIYTQTSRNTNINLEGKALVEMKVGFDENYLAVTVADQFGSLKKAAVVTHLMKSYIDESYKLKLTSAGAGLGLGNVFRSGANFIFSCDQGVRTEVSLFFKRTASFKDFKQQFRFLGTQFYF
ncbi:MAG: hypothetical protein KA715_01205 [Xanthomonadaceae bacterium]|nr:hypothetical protein [Xanthomonadaceae bacterium]